jgi:lipoate-protein ligase A
MAMDVALARCLREDQGVLRIYRWSRPTLSLGRNQAARDRYDPFAAERLGAEIVRRPTGGREVVHDRELTYAVVLPLSALGGLRESYRTLNGALLSALRSLGVPAEVAKPARRAPAPDGGACFLAPAAGEIVVHGRKLVGSAQARIGDTLLQHGTLLLAPPSVSLEALQSSPGPIARETAGRGGEAWAFRGMGRPSPLESAAVTLSEILVPSPGFPGIAAAVEAAFAGALGGEWVRDRARAAELEVAAALVPHYESLSWTWRR